MSTLAADIIVGSCRPGQHGGSTAVKESNESENIYSPLLVYVCHCEVLYFIRYFVSVGDSLWRPVRCRLSKSASQFVVVHGAQVFETSAISWQFRHIGGSHTVVGRSLSPVHRRGTHCRNVYPTLPTALLFLTVFSKHAFFQSTRGESEGLNHRATVDTPCSCNFWPPWGWRNPHCCQTEGLLQLFTLTGIAE